MTRRDAEAFAARAAELDAADPLAEHREQFLLPDDVVAYLDGNSLGAPMRATAEAMDRFVRDRWSGRLIRGWTDEWMWWPERVGDRLGAVILGAAEGQVVVADSTTVMLYKLARAAIDARPGRNVVVLDTDNFPTDRYILEGIAAERDLELRWVETAPDAGITVEQVRDAVRDDTALALFSHVAYRSAYIADAAAITAAVHDAGALMLWDLSHSVGSVELALDEWGVDLAVGCTYKYLNGGPGAPAFGYVRRDLTDELQQPIWGWMGHADSFAMGPGYTPAPGVRSVVSGTPPILAMVPLSVSLDMHEAAGMAAVRAKSKRLTELAVDLHDAWLAPHGVELGSPRDPELRGGHVTVRRADFREVTDRLWDKGVIPDFRAPDGIRLGLAPLSTSFAQVHDGIAILADLVEDSAPSR